jgi:hypothetical protein
MRTHAHTKGGRVLILGRVGQRDLHLTPPATDRDRIEESPGVTIRWFTDADRQDIRDAEAERRVLAELVDEYVPTREITGEGRAERIARRAGSA